MSPNIGLGYLYMIKFVLWSCVAPRYHAECVDIQRIKNHAVLYSNSSIIINSICSIVAFFVRVFDMLLVLNAFVSWSECIIVYASL